MAPEMHVYKSTLKLLTNSQSVSTDLPCGGQPDGPQTDSEALPESSGRLSEQSDIRCVLSESCLCNVAGWDEKGSNGFSQMFRTTRSTCV